MQSSMAGELKWEVVMHGERYIVQIMIVNAAVVNFAYQVSGVHPEIQYPVNHAKQIKRVVDNCTSLKSENIEE